MNADPSPVRRMALLLSLPVIFNMYMWQNYTVSAECLLPDGLRTLGPNPSFLGFGFAFGLLTVLLSSVCFSSLCTILAMMKKESLSGHLKSHRAVYNAVWLFAFSLAGFAGFVLMVGFRSSSAGIQQIYCEGLEGLLASGLAAGIAALIFAATVLTVKQNVEKLRVVAISTRRDQS